MILKDTAQGSEEFAYIFVRAAIDPSGGYPLDSIGLKNDGFMSVERGDIIRLRGYIAEFPTNQMTSVTQFTPVPGLSISSIPGPPIIPAIPKSVADFHRGLAPANPPFPQNGIQFSTGEPYEGAYVELTDLTVVATQGSSGGTTYVRLVDNSGNMISTYDLSRWFTLRGPNQSYDGFIVKDPNSTYALPSIGAKIDTIKGMITTVSNNQQHGYFIAPVFPGDIKFGIVLPGIRTHRRTPIIVTSQDTVQVSIMAYKQAGTGIRAVYLWHQLNAESWLADSINGPHLTDSVYTFSVGKLSDGDVFRYFFEAVDSAGNTSTYANNGTGTSSDTAKGKFFYQVFDRPLTISDVQYTPYSNGVSPYWAAKTMVTGIVISDTSQLKPAPDTRNIGPWYIQASNQPWNGLWINTSTASNLLDSLRVGDSIAVQGTIDEYYDVTRFEDIDSLIIYSRGNITPEPVVVSTGSLGTRANGDPLAEQWESMLVRVNNIIVTDISPTGYADLTEMEVNDGSGRLIVRMAEGKHNYSNIAGDLTQGKTILKVGDQLDFLQGIVWYSFNKYKIVPRIDSDFGTITAINDLATHQTPKEFVLSQNYPNPFNPVTTIEFDISTGGFVTLRVYNILGQEVKTLIDEYRIMGHYTARFDASRLPSGMYIYRLQSTSGTISKRMVLIK
jgi:hypothetical protein